MFIDRKEAGEKLAQCLLKYKKDKRTIVLAIPNGRVPVAIEIAKILKLPLDFKY